jgi:hypothetical protein
MSDRLPALELEDEDAVFIAVGGAGVASLTLGLIVDSPALRACGLVGLLAGGGLLVRRRLAARSDKIDSATDAIRSELEDLDPVARAQVLADVARSQL